MARLTEEDLNELVPDDDPQVIAGMAALAVLRQLEQVEQDGLQP